MAVEDVLGGDELVPIGWWSLVPDDFTLHRMAASRRQQSDVAGIPSGVHERFDLGVRLAERIVDVDFDPLDLFAGTIARDRRFEGEVSEARDDLLGVPEVLVELDGIHGDRGFSVTAEDPLALIGEDGESALDLIAQT